jgi:hypothetical protein
MKWAMPKKPASYIRKYVKNGFLDSFGLQNLRLQGAKIPLVGLFFDWWGCLSMVPSCFYIAEC